MKLSLPIVFIIFMYCPLMGMYKNSRIARLMAQQIPTGLAHIRRYDLIAIAQQEYARIADLQKSDDTHTIIAATLSAPSVSFTAHSVLNFITEKPEILFSGSLGSAAAVTGLIVWQQRKRARETEKTLQSLEQIMDEIINEEINSETQSSSDFKS